MKIVIVGGVAGGASAAARLRRLDEHAEIILFEKGQHISYANCGLPYYVSRTIKKQEDLLVQTPKSFNGRFCIDIRTMNEVIRINREYKRVEVYNHVTKETYFETYDKLILSPGARAVKPSSVQGLDNEGVFTLRDVPDIMEIDNWILENEPEHATIAGGGAAGIELAENLIMRGLKVTLVGSAIIKAVDKEMSKIAEKELKKNGVELLLNRYITSVQKNAANLVVHTTDGDVQTGMLIVCAGVVPNSKLAAEAGLKLGVRDCIAINDKMETSDPDIYAVGDVTESTEFITREKKHISLAGPANRQGRIVANQIMGIDLRYKGTQSSFVIKVFDIAVASTGITEITAKDLGIDYDKVYMHAGAHAGYYPGAKPLTSKIIFERTTGRVLGGQFVGAEGADKRCDVLATAIRAGLTATDLMDLELCYAPPFNSAKDPLNMAGFIIENIMTGMVNNFHWENLNSVSHKEGTLLDVRTKQEAEKNHVSKFINIPLHELRIRINEIPPGKPVYVHCFSGLRSYVACRLLKAHGFECYNLSGGIFMYSTINS